MAASLHAMPRPATGTVETYRWKDGSTVTYRLRVRALGARHRINLGTNHQGWSEARARVELDHVMAQIRRGTWEPPSTQTPASSPPGADETVHVTASRWWERRHGELAENTRIDYRKRLDHVLRYLAHEPTGRLDARRIDDFRGQLEQRGLGPRTVNMVLGLLAQVLDDAVDYGLLEANPARGRRRRPREPRPARSFLEPDQVLAVLDAAGTWERSLPAHQRYGRRAVLATLALGGLRVGELIAADRGDLDLPGGRLRVRDAKTPAGDRHVELTAFLQGELRSHLAAIPAALSRQGPALPLFPTRTGGRLQATNLRRRLLAGAIKRASTERMALPARVTPHALRRTFASLALAAGRDVRWVMGQLGHADARMTLNVYAQVLQRQRVDRELVWELMRFGDETEHALVQGLTQRPESGTPPASERRAS